MEKSSHLSLYPVDMSSVPGLSHYMLDASGIPYDTDLAGYNPLTIVSYALVQWNQYLATCEEQYRGAFLLQVEWLIEREVKISEQAGGWPISFPFSHRYNSSSWLSATVQAAAISLLVRAYQLTGENIFCEVAQRAVCTFNLDILDGGVSTPIGADGIFFEDVAVYPATHILSGFLFAIHALYDYKSLVDSPQIEELLDKSLRTLHRFIDDFDAGFWTYKDLFHNYYETPGGMSLQIALLEAVAHHSKCDYCMSRIVKWCSYQKRASSRLLYLIVNQSSTAYHSLLKRVRSTFFPTQRTPSKTRICVAVTAFPMLGGIRAVLSGLAQATSDIWQIEYLTHVVGPNPEALIIHSFGKKYMSWWQFPNVWLYVSAGFQKLIVLMRQGASYDVILPQDGIYTAAFVALAARVFGARVVCIDHGTLTLLKNYAYRTERKQSLAAKQASQFHYLLARLRYMWYWPSFYLFARIAACLVDHFLIPGVANDAIEESCNRLGIHPARITRFGSMIDIERHFIPDPLLRATMREQKGIAAEAIVVAIICRLSPEKGIDIALEAISQALAALPPTRRSHLQVVIAGDGPLREQVEKDISRRNLKQNSVLWGELSKEDVISLLAMTDIFLYTSRRGACFSMAVLEAMASGCAVIATTEPISNAHLLSAGRGMAVSVTDVKQIATALVQLVNETELRCGMGQAARNYIAKQHSMVMFRRTLLRATHWSALSELVKK